MNPARTGAHEDLALLRRGPVAILGYGHQGEAHALNLRDAGLEVVVGARAGHAAFERAVAHGFAPLALGEAVTRAATVAMLLPDEVVPELWHELGPPLERAHAVVFAHGYNLLYGALTFGAATDAVLVSPTGPGAVLRERFVAGAGLPAYLAVHQDASGSAWQVAEAYAYAIGCGRATLIRTTVREETEVDLFGEQVVLCGGMNALVTAAFETLVEAGYSPEIAYLECVQQLAALADMLRDRGVTGVREGISATALFGDLTRGPRVIGASSRAEMHRILDQIRNGAFAREWGAEAARGKPLLAAGLAASRAHPIEQARRRALRLPES
ncbi:MAG: ketol-acid reductoisomerase [Candidatus Eisenbacteria bacterium]|uniref:Ketol-acid reductoisomerase n=1 Tax=Eiseniibacteriota bacterium TaxID=2212470 RepID=A0A849SDF4_UNCEI|nr:ketol-acid reductoisomerase [Candidatus Eisenbacteria bacterium]